MPESTNPEAVTAHDGAEPAWRRRAVDRSTQVVRQRAATRVQQFLDTARSLIDEKQSTDVTVQEVVDRSGQSLRSFYQYFDGKHELLLALFEEEMISAADRLREVSADGDPIERLRDAVGFLFESSRPSPKSSQPLFADFASRLMVDHPDEVTAAYVPVFEYLAEIVEGIAERGQLRDVRPRRAATIVLQAATVTAGRTSTDGSQPITAAEVWEFCLNAIVPDDVIAGLGAD
jgi:AcrR family transcriptional regulator